MKCSRFFGFWRSFCLEFFSGKFADQIGAKSFAPSNISLLLHLRKAARAYFRDKLQLSD